MHTPNSVSVLLLKTLITAVDALADDQQNIDQRTLLLGMASAIGDLVASISPRAQQELLPELLDAIVSRVEGGALLVVRSEPPPMH